MQKILQQQKLETVFLVNIQCKQFWGFDHMEDKNTLYRGKDCMNKFCTSLREHGKNIIDFQKKKMIPLTKEDVKSHQDGKLCYIC